MLQWSITNMFETNEVESFSKCIEDINKSQMEILELNGTITEVKNLAEKKGGKAEKATEIAAENSWI